MKPSPRNHSLFNLLFLVLMTGCVVENNDLENEREARVQASRLFGLKDAGNLKAQHRLIEQSPIPFIGGELNGKDGWLVEINEFPVKFGEQRDVVNPYISGFEVLLSSKDSKIIEIRSIGSANENLKPNLPDRHQAETRMLATPKRFVGLPQEVPRISIDTLLQKAWKQGFARIDQAKEIRINYVLYSNELQNITAEPRWIIHVRGIPPIPGRGLGATIPTEQRSHLRLFYDADGQLLSADNLLR